MLSKDVEFNEKLHDKQKINIYSVALLYLTKNLKKTCFWDCKDNFRNIF